MNKKELQAVAQAAAKSIKTEADLNEFRQMLTKITVETALSTELDDHLGFARHESSESGNSRNGYTSKTLRTEDGQFELNTPRDRAGSFEPQLVKKHQRRFTSMDDVPVDSTCAVSRQVVECVEWNSGFLGTCCANG